MLFRALLRRRGGTRKKYFFVAVGALLAVLALVLFLPDGKDNPSRPSTRVESIVQSTRGLALHLWRSGLDRIGIPRKNPGRARKAGGAGKPELAVYPAKFEVVDQQGKPVLGAKITVSPGGKGKARSAQSDARGSALLALPPARYDILVTHRDYAPLEHKKFIVPAQKNGARVKLQLTAGVTLAGKVTDEDKRPLMGVVVSGQRRRLEQFSAGGDVYLDDAAYRDQLTDEKGEFRLEGVGYGENLLNWRLTGYAPENRTLDLRPGKKPAVQNVILRRPAVIGGRILDEDQNPVSTATVSVRDFFPYGWNAEGVPPLKSKTTTDTSGTFQLKRLLTDGAYEVRVEHPAFAPGIFPRVPADTRDVLWVLNRGGLFEGQAVWIDAPTSPAQVVMRAEAVIEGTTYTRQLTTSHDGTFSFDRMPYGTYKLRVAQEGFASEPLRDVKSIRDRPTTGILVEVYRTALLAGRVVDAGTGSPVPGAKVTVHASYGPGGKRKRNFTLEAGSNGRFEFRRLPAGAHTITGRAEGYLASQVANSERDEIMLLAGARVQDFVLRLSRGGAVEGYVRDTSGSGVPDAEVQLFTASPLTGTVNARNLHTVTDGSGHFAIRGFPMPEHLQLYASARHPAFAKARSPLIELTTELPSAHTEIILTPGGSVRGTVTDISGRPLANTKITFSSREFPYDPSESARSTETNAEGTYFIQNCTPGLARITASRPGFVAQTRSATVKDGKMLDRLNFKLLQGHQITGVLADYSGNPVADARITATPLEKTTGSGRDTTNKKGEFTLRGLGSGYFRLEANFAQLTAQGKQQYTFILPRVASGSLGVPFDCDLEAGASGKVVDEEGRGVKSFRMVIRSRTDTQPPQDFRFSLDRVYKLSGLFQLEKVPRGLYNIEVEADGYETHRSSDLIIGPHKTTRVPLIRLKRAARIRGRVVSATSDEPVNNAIVRILDSSLPEAVTVTRTELAAYPRQDILEFLEITYSTDYDLEPQRLLRPYARVRGNVTTRSRTDFAGLFEINDLGSGRYVVEIEHPSYEPVRLENVVVSRDNSVDLGDIHLQPGARVQGRVLDGDGVPVVNAVVRIPGERTGRNLARTDAGGNYVIRGVRAGRWAVTVRTTVQNRPVYAYQFAEVRQDQTTRVDFLLELSATAEGTVSAPDHSVRNGGTVRLFPMDENAAPVHDIQYTGSIRGRSFSISSIPPGRYLALATGSASGGAFTFIQVVDVPRGESHHNLVLGTGQISGTAVASNETPSARVRLQLRPSWPAFPLPPSINNLLVRTFSTPANGRFNFRYLQPGLWNLYAGHTATTVLLGEFYLTDGQQLTGIVVPVEAE